ncbi:MAG: hypothetical protein ACOWWO_08540 [Peptococcaceae bacterium]
MGKRRGKINDFFEQDNHCPNDKSTLVKGGDDFDYCIKLFLEDLDLKNLSFHTKRWHRENLEAIKKLLFAKNLPIEPVNITEKDLKQCILFWKREANNY